MTTPDRSLLIPVLGGVIALVGAASAQAQDERGRVISATPVVQQVVVPREVCQNVTVRGSSHPSGAGALLGAVAGGAAGNAIGSGSGRAAATAIGIFGGAILGNHIEGGGHRRTRTVEECTTQNTYDNQIVAYNVVYEYAGREYRTQMPQDPGRWVPVSVQPVMTAPAQPSQSYHPAQPSQGYYTQQREPEIVRIGGHRRDGHHRDGYRRYDDDRGRDNGHWDR
jgi:uncharacterized protein YcfJ